MFSSTVLEHAASPTYRGALPDANRVGQDGEEGQGPWMRISLRVQVQAQADSSENRIEEARFETYSCPAAIACGNWLCGWLRGKSLALAQRIEAGDLSLLLGGLPPGKESCARMTIRALSRALSRHQQPPVLEPEPGLAGAFD